MTATTGLVWSSAFLSHRGAVRRVNQDSCLEAPDLGLWAVADGMGGHEAGQTASRMIIDALDAEPVPAAGDAFVTYVRDRLVQVNRQLVALSQSEYDGRTIGSTVCVLIACAADAVCLWAGDSRIYRLRDGSLEQLTRDHSRVEELVAMGVLDRAEAAGHSLANVVTRAVGAQADLALEARRDPVVAGDRFLLCSDGLNRVVADEEIARALAGRDCRASADSLLTLALDRRTNDNVTVGVVHADGAATALDPTDVTLVPARSSR